MSETVCTEIIVGVDTHKDVHVAVAISALGARLDTKTIPVGAKGYRDLAAWALSFGAVRAFGIEGTGGIEVAPISWTVCGLGGYVSASAVCMLAS